MRDYFTMDITKTKTTLKTIFTQNSSLKPHPLELVQEVELLNQFKKSSQ